MDYDTWKTQNPDEPRYCPECLRDRLTYDGTAATCDCCDWRGTLDDTLNTFQMRAEARERMGES